MSKIKTTITILLLVSLCIYIFSQFRETINDRQKDTISDGRELHNIELMAELENRVAAENLPNGSQTTMDEDTDYTTMYPDLYTVYDLPDEMPEGRKIAYLTFDDGPSENTYEILDILEEMDVKATFFIVGSSISADREDCLKRMKYEGHTIGIHTYSHLCNEIYCSVERFLDDFNLVYQQIYEITGERVNIYRFPWGSNNYYSKNIKDSLMDEMERRGFLCYDWSVDANDSIGRPTAYSIRHNIEKDLKKQEFPIILMHDSASNDLTVRTLPGIIRMLKEKGYEFDTLDHREPFQFNW
jgi:peptidoglycan/xylan/chitin deacetylase (PgdA/CDA1 family)